MEKYQVDYINTIIPRIVIEIDLRFTQFRLKENKTPKKW